MIEANGVIKSYGLGGSKTDVLKGIDLQISDGDFAVILGASGSGKFTEAMGHFFNGDMGVAINDFLY